jgi:hypothetical protein
LFSDFVRIAINGEKGIREERNGKVRWRWWGSWRLRYVLLLYQVSGDGIGGRGEVIRGNGRRGVF